MSTNAIDGGYLTTREIAVLIGRTANRVRQYARGDCGCEALPADRADGGGCQGYGQFVTSAESFSAWLNEWETYPGRW